MNKQSDNYYEAGGDVNVNYGHIKKVTKNKTIIKNNKLTFVVVFAFC